MPNVRGCNLPDGPRYEVPNHIGFPQAGHGYVPLGTTAVATATARRLAAFTPRGVAKDVKAENSCATIESGKGVGPAAVARGGAVASMAAHGFAGLGA